MHQKDDTMSQNIQATTLTLNGIDYIRADSVVKASPPLGPTQIIVADKGFVFVGNVVENNDGTVTLHNARNIRRWGTTTGLGQLAAGPTPETKYDAYGTVQLTPILRIGVTGGW
jgi:hypothetical protein